MFNNGKDFDKYLYVNLKAKKVAKIFVIFCGIVFLILTIALILAIEEPTVGTFVMVFSCFGLCLFGFYQIIQCTVWTYYWLAEKGHDGALAIYLSMTFGVYIGFALRIKYRSMKRKYVTNNSLYHTR